MRNEYVRNFARLRACSFPTQSEPRPRPDGAARDRPPDAQPDPRRDVGATGPIRAADIARDLGIPANQASFHLRQLAKYGLVEEAAGAGRDKRDRVWRVVAEEGLHLPAELEKAPGGKAAVGVYRRNASAWAHLLVDRAYAPTTREDTIQTVSEQLRSG